MSLPTVMNSGVAEINAVNKTIANLESYKKKFWGIGLNGSSFQPDGFLRFFVERSLPFSIFVVNHGVTIGTKDNYDKNIATLQAHADKVRKSETEAAKKTIAQLESYKSKFWGIGLTGDTLQPDHFNTFFSERDLPFLPFVRSGSGVSIGEQSAYDKNIDTLEQYVEGLGSTIEKEEKEIGIDPDFYYRLSTMFRGDDMNLDIFNGGANNNQPHLTKAADFSGQYWKILPSGNKAYVRLATMFRGDNMNLDVFNGGPKNNMTHLVPKANFSGQFWKLTKTDKKV